MPLIRVNAIFGAAPRLGPMYLIDAELGRAGAPRAPSLCQPWESVAAASVHAAGGPVWMRLSAMSVITASARLTRVCLLPRPRMMCCQYAKLWWMRLLVYRKAFVRFGSVPASDAPGRSDLRGDADGHPLPRVAGPVPSISQQAQTGTGAVA